MTTDLARLTQPLAGTAGFFNRTSEIMRICSRIGADRPQSVSVVGEPKVGKTSLLNWLYDREARGRYLEEPERYVFLSLDLATAPPRDPTAFFQRLTEAWQAQGGSAAEPTYDGLSAMVKGLMEERRRLVVLLDDFGRVTANSSFPVGFFSFMRSLANGSDVGYVTTSSTDLQKLCSTQDLEESPFFNIFTTVHLEPFKQDEARQLVEHICSEAGCRPGPEVEWTLALAGGSPYLLRLCAALLVGLQQAGQVDPARLESTAFREARGYLDCLWQEHLSEVQRDVLRHVQAGREVARQHGYALTSLERRGHLSQTDSTYALRSGLLARYVRERGGGLWKRLFG
ncbi:MAG: ATP-binding protein [Candidatus Latescibacterota bacterium]